MAKAKKPVIPNPVISYSVPINHKGKHYAGISAHDGVGLKLIDSPCGSARQLVTFEGCDQKAYPPGIFFDGVTCLNDQAPPVKEYLQLKPLVPTHSTYE